MISDVPWGSQKIGSSVEEFIVDGLILMLTDFEDGDLKRTMRILKMRTTNHSKKTIAYEITDEGIQINEKRR
jgi:KaiC/GvpD/RAD55 family RecA-like ATPase